MIHYSNWPFEFSGRNMGPYRRKVISKLGQSAWDFLMGEVDGSRINGQNMKDIAFSLHETIGAKHELRMNSTKKLSQESRVLREHSKTA